jgi:hypothetical protein
VIWTITKQNGAVSKGQPLFVREPIYGVISASRVFILAK